MTNEAEQENQLRTEWNTEARAQTLETLPGFLSKLAEREHDYGTICLAVTAAAVGAASAMDRSPRGGITGFQASIIFWEFFRAWMQEEGPVSLRRWEHMLFPQYADRFEKTIPRETWEWLQAEARKRIDRRTQMHPDVKLHMADIAAGFVPFGYEVSHD